MRVLVIGSGGREHALAWRMAQDEGVTEVLVSPGNPGMAVTPKVTTHPTVGLDLKETIDFAVKSRVSLIVFGPEKPILEGWADHFESLGIPVFAPRKAAAFLEGSKIQAKRFFLEHQIPTARFFEAKDAREAKALLKQCADWKGVVVKLSGPALGKGVFVCANIQEAEAALDQLIQTPQPGQEEGLILEELLLGREVSMFYLIGPNQPALFLGSACDHKRLLENDLGPNTGGMGAYAPAQFFPKHLEETVLKKIIEPTLEGLRQRGTSFTGVLFAGLMVSDQGPMLLEYNVRFGDPETQALMPLLQGNLSETLRALSLGQTMSGISLKSDSVCVHIVQAAKGYPGLFGAPIERGQTIQACGEPMANGTECFYSGVTGLFPDLTTSGGRVLGISAVGRNTGEAKSLAESESARHTFVNAQWRRDIGKSAL